MISFGLCSVFKCGMINGIRLKFRIMNFTVRIHGLFIILLILSGCSTKRLLKKQAFVSVKDMGAMANGINDDRPSIQNAFAISDTVYFPPGTYFLDSKFDHQSILYLDDFSSARTLIFDSLALLFVSSSLPKDYIKPAVLHIRAIRKDIDEINISGLKIDGNHVGNQLDLLGIVAIENKGVNINLLNLDNVSIQNVGHTGIHTQAKNNHFTNIKTQNCGKHGIGIINPNNPRQTTTIHLDGYYSEGDKGYSIDFSGDKNPKNRRILKNQEKYLGHVNNVISINSGFGIKTAGLWDLSLNNIKIINSGNNGFMVNHDAPYQNIEMSNIFIENAQNNGLSLKHKTNIKGKNLSIIGCKTAINIGQSNVEFDSLLVDGKNRNNAGIRMGSSKVTLNNFEIKNNSEKDLYPIWVSGSEVVLRNGIVANNKSPFGLIIHEKAKLVRIDNLVIKGENLKGGVLNIQKEGNTIIKNSDFSDVKGDKIIDKRGKILVQKVIGIDSIVRK